MISSVSGINNNQNVNFCGSVDRKSAKLAKNLSSEVYEALSEMAKSLHKKAIVSIEPKGELTSQYTLYAYDPRFYGKYSLDLSETGSMAQKIREINPTEVEETIINEGINTLQKSADFPINTTERRMIKAEAKDILKVQRETGIYRPFWGDINEIIRKAREKYDKEAIEAARKFDFYKVGMKPDPVETYIRTLL